MDDKRDLRMIKKTIQGHQIIDDFLPKEDLQQLYSVITAPDFDWYYIKDIVDAKNDLGAYFVHVAYHQGKASHLMHIVSPILTRLNIKSLIRVKINLYFRTSTLEVHAPHVDDGYSRTGAIFYLNTNNGKTILEDGTQIDSIANRVLLFDPSTKHSSTSTTDSKARFNININYK